ncbi:MAG: DciA family protein [Actinomycetota bacterium]|nr:DciA family protein [Actinomycetota bacterium]
MPAEPGEHDPTGGELARAVARGYRDTDPSRRSGVRLAGRGRRAAGGPWTGGAAGRREVQLSGPGPDERDPQRLDRSLSELVVEHGWAAQVAVHGLFSRWDAVVGGEVAQHCRPEQFVDGALAVRADSTAWATEMRLLAPMLLQRLNDSLGDGMVRRIDVRAPTSPSWRHGRFTVRGGRGPRDTYG